MTKLAIGDTAPDFTLPKNGGGTLSLSDYRGKKVVLYLYPQDNTPTRLPLTAPPSRSSGVGTMSSRSRTKPLRRCSRASKTSASR